MKSIVHTRSCRLLRQGIASRIASKHHRLPRLPSETSTSTASPSGVYIIHEVHLTQDCVYNCYLSTCVVPTRDPSLATCR